MTINTPFAQIILIRFIKDFSYPKVVTYKKGRIIIRKNFHVDSSLCYKILKIQNLFRLDENPDSSQKFSQERPEMGWVLLFECILCNRSC